MKQKNKGVYRYDAKRAYRGIWIRWERGVNDVFIRGRKCVVTIGDVSKETHDAMKKVKRSAIGNLLKIAGAGDLVGVCLLGYEGK